MILHRNGDSGTRRLTGKAPLSAAHQVAERDPHGVVAECARLQPRQVEQILDDPLHALDLVAAVAQELDAHVHVDAAVPFPPVRGRAVCGVGGCGCVSVAVRLLPGAAQQQLVEGLERGHRRAQLM